MKPEEYRKLNEYLNGCFKKLEVKDHEFLDNLEYFITLSESYIKMTNNLQLKEQPKKEIKLSYEGIYLLAREVIESINPLYLEDYDRLITSGTIDFSYNNEYYDSHFTYNYGPKNYFELININLEFTYNDIGILVHEFMHKTNAGKKRSINRYLLTEFISIYFQEYTKNYLLEKGIPKEELDCNRRIISTKKASSCFNWYSLIILVYKNIGKIDENSYKFLNDFYLPICKEDFEIECKNTLDTFEKAEQAYKMKIMYRESFDEDKMYENLVELINTNYRYILGTTLAFYALQNCDIKKIVYLNDHINDEQYANMSLCNVLHTIGINMDSIDIEELMGIIEAQIKENESKVK